MALNKIQRLNLFWVFYRWILITNVPDLSSWKTHRWILITNVLLKFRSVIVRGVWSTKLVEKVVFWNSVQWAASIGALFGSPRGRETAQPKSDPNLSAWKTHRWILITSVPDLCEFFISAWILVTNVPLPLMYLIKAIYNVPWSPRLWNLNRSYNFLCHPIIN